MAYKTQPTLVQYGRTLLKQIETINKDKGKVVMDIIDTPFETRIQALYKLLPF